MNAHLPCDQSHSAVPAAPARGRRGGATLAQWAIAFALGVIATALVYDRPGRLPGGVAYGQLGTSAGARGVFAFTGQLTRNSFGVFMVDVDTSTIWAYEYDQTKQCLRLAAARTWRYDRYLEDFNGCDLPPENVAKMVEQERERRLNSADAQPNGSEKDSD